MFDRLIPRVRKAVSLAATAASYTNHCPADGVPADPIIPILYVCPEVDVLQIAIVDITAVVEALVLYKVVYVPTADVPCTPVFLYDVAIFSSFIDYIIFYAPIRKKDPGPPLISSPL